MGMGPGQPHDLAVIERIGDETAARSEQGAQLLRTAYASLGTH